MSGHGGVAWLVLSGARVFVCAGCGVAFLIPEAFDPPPACPRCERAGAPAMVHAGDVHVLGAVGGEPILVGAFGRRGLRAALRRTRRRR